MNPKSRRENTYIEKLDGETVVYDKSNHHAYCLNATATAVWEHADGTRTIGDLAEVLNAKLGIPKDCQAVLLGLDQLERAGLLATQQPAVTMDLPSRRQIAGKFAMAGVSAALFPLVASVLAPTPAMAASTVGGGNPIASYEQDLQNVRNEIRQNLQAYNNSPTAQSDLNAGFNVGGQGVAAALQGNNALAQSDFQAAASDFDGALKALGLGPL